MKKNKKELDNKIVIYKKIKEKNLPGPQIINTNVGYFFDMSNNELGIALEYIKGNYFNGAKNELALTLDKIQLLEQKIVLKDSVILSLNSQVGNFESIMSTKSDQLALSQELSRKLQTDLKKQKLKTKLIGGAGLVAIAGVVIILK